MKLHAGAIAAIVTVAAGIAVAKFAAAPKPAPPFAAVAGDRPAVARPAPPKNVVVYVAGSVAHPGVYALSGAARTADAVHSAGGALAAADLVAVNLAEPLSDGEEIVVPVKGEAVPDAAPAPRHHRTRKRAKRHRSGHARRRHAPRPVQASDVSDAVPVDPVDLNRADEAELETLPGIGPALAGRIVAFRDLNGSFASYDDLLDVAGMTQERLDKIQPFLASLR